jgi:hypothetical protein
MRDYAEQSFQITACDFLALNGLLGVHVPNEGERSRGAAGRAAAAGLRKGFPDLLVFDRKRPLNIAVRGVVVSDARGLLCVAELKRPRRRSMRTKTGWTARKQLDDDQIKWADEMRARGVLAFGPWDCVEDIVRDLEAIGVDLNARVMG